MTTELYINGKLMDGLQRKEIIAFTYALYQIGDVTARQGNYSNLFKVIRTKNNREILQNPERVDGATEVPYRRNDASIAVNGIEVFRGFAVVEESDDFFHVRVYGGISDFFVLIGDKSIRDIDFSDLNHDWNNDEVQLRRETQPGDDEVLYPNINYGNLFDWIGIDGNADIRADFFFPGLYVKTIIDRAAAEEGWTFESDAGFDFLAFCLEEFVSRKTVPAERSVGAGEDYVYTWTGTVAQPLTSWNDDFMAFPTEVLNPYNFFRSANNGHSYTVVSGHEFVIEGKIVWERISGDGSDDMELGLRYSSGANEEEIVNIGIAPPLDSGEFEFSSDAAEFSILSQNSINGIRVQTRIIDHSGFNAIRILEGSFLRIVDGYYRNTGSINPTPEPQPISIADSLIDISIKELILFEARRQNAIIVPDADNQILRFVKFDEIAMSEPVDWSGKLDLTQEPILIFELSEIVEGFSQRNILKWLPSEIDISFLANPELGWGEIRVDDEKLPRQSDMYEAPFAASARLPIGESKEIFALHIPLLDPDSNPGDQPEIVNDPEPRMCEIFFDDSWQQDLINQTAITDQPQCQFPGWQNYVDENYQGLIEAVRRAKYVKAFFNLQPSDIATLDLTRPVWVEHFNALFYVDEVDEWKANRNESTRVKLVRL